MKWPESLQGFSSGRAFSAVQTCCQGGCHRLGPSPSPPQLPVSLGAEKVGAWTRFDRWLWQVLCISRVSIFFRQVWHHIPTSPGIDLMPLGGGVRRQWDDSARRKSTCSPHIDPGAKGMLRWTAASGSFYSFGQGWGGRGPQVNCSLNFSYTSLRPHTLEEIWVGRKAEEGYTAPLCL